MPVSKAVPAYHSFKLHSYWRSTASWRVRIALAMKNISYEMVPVDLMKLAQDNVSRVSAETAELNPMEQIPILEFVEASSGTKHVLTQSVAIMEFLEEAFPNTRSIYPVGASPVLRARVRQCAEIVNSGIAPVQNLAIIRQVKQVVLTGEDGDTVDGRGFCKHNVQKGLTSLEKLAAPHYNPSTNAIYMGGTCAPSIADICLVPQMYNANRFGVDLTQFPTLMKIKANCDVHSFFQVAKPEAQPDASL